MDGARAGARAAGPGMNVADLMKQAACVWFPLALTLLLRSSPSFAQQEDEKALLQQARTEVARALGAPAAGISFQKLRLVRDKLGTLVCGMVDGKRFLAGPGGKPPPQIEGALSASMFDYLWNARCEGMSASNAEDVFRRELK